VPQIGWNAVRFTREHPVTAGLPAEGHFYFVNSYYCAPLEPADALGLTDYSVEFCSVVARDNVLATQFHAEKSGELGLALLRNFASWDPSC
jgi:glutamine amidotransferase